MNTQRILLLVLFVLLSATVGVSYTEATSINPTDAGQEEQNYILPWQETVIQIEEAKQAGFVCL